MLIFAKTNTPNMATDITERLYTEILRPKEFNNMVLPTRLKNEFSAGLVQNMMLYGPPGSGKTTAARILCRDHDTMVLNGSEERSIDTVRGKIMGFASTVSLQYGESSIKVIFIDECDGFTNDAWDSMRNVIEKFADGIRFICTCNRIDKIPAAIQSRFQCIPMFPINSQETSEMFEMYVKYTGAILSKLGISYDDQTLREYVKNSRLDMRKILNPIQMMHMQGATALDKNSISSTFDCGDLLEMIFTGKDPVENYRFITSEYSSNPDDIILSIGRDFVDFLIYTYPQYSAKVPYCTIAIAEHMAQMNDVSDKLVLLLSLVYKLQIIING